MKKLLATFALLIMFVVAGFSQSFAPQQQSQYYVPHPDNVTLTNITLNQIQNGWARSGNSCAGCASYWYQVYISQTQHKAEDGNYYFYYYFKFFSNSFYGNGNPAGTYLSQMSYYMNGDFILSAEYLLLPQGQMTWGAWMRSLQNNVTVSFNITQISVY